jgi:hypothetical protein
MKKMFLSVCIIALSTTAFTTISKSNKNDDMKNNLENLSGIYRDPKPVNWGRGTFGSREFTFSKGKWTLNFILALDPEMKNQVFVFRTFGTYKVWDKSTKVPNAYNALFLEDKKFVTLKTSNERIIMDFGLTQCGFTKDVEKDISVTGCSLWKPVTQCNEDHELLALDNEGKLYFGLRPANNDMCSADKRPTKLNVPVVKIN